MKIANAVLLLYYLLSIRFLLATLRVEQTNQGRYIEMLYAYSKYILVQDR